jgi:hypothetical protein
MSGQVPSYFSAEVQDHESHKAAFPTSEVTSLESSYAPQIRDDTAEPTTNAADSENHNDVLLPLLQAAHSGTLTRISHATSI